MDCLHRIIEGASKFRLFVSSYTNSPLGLTSAEIPTMRFYLRKIEGAEILLSHETNFFRQELHKWNPIAPEPPPTVENSQSTRKPRPTKQQKLMAQMGIHNPDDLPPQYRTKAHIFKKKVGEPNGKPPTIRPALAGNNGSPSPPDQAQMYDYQRYGSTTSHGSPTFSQPSYGTPGSPLLVNNPGRGQTLDPALYNGYSGQRVATCSSSGSPPYHAANSREENSMFELYTKEPSSGPGASGYESNAAPALESTAAESLESMDQYLHHDP